MSVLAVAVWGSSDVLSPDSSLTNIWKLSVDGDEDEDEDVEEAVDEEREVRMLGDTVGEYRQDGCIEVDARVTRLVRR